MAFDWHLTTLALILLCSAALSSMPSQAAEFTARTDRDPYSVYSALADFNPALREQSPHLEAIDNIIARNGKAMVWIRLDQPFEPDGKVQRQRGQDAVRQQRDALRTAEAQLAGQLDQAGIKVVRQFDGFIPWLVAKVDAAERQTVQTLEGVAGIRPVQEFSAALAESTRIIRAREDAIVPTEIGAWGFGFDGQGQLIAVLDSGIRRDHETFSPASVRLVHEACFSTRSLLFSRTPLCANGESVQYGPGSAAEGYQSSCDGSVNGCGHGSHVAAIAAGNPTASGGNHIGVAKAAGIIPVGVFHNNNGGTAATGEDVASGLAHVYQRVQAGDTVAAVNLSLSFYRFGGGGYSDWCTHDQGGVTDAIAQLVHQQVAVVAATGNEGFENAISYPACLGSTVAVSSSYRMADVFFDGANVSGTTDFLAPGNAIYSADANHPSTSAYISKPGTSMATPHVSGAIAIMRQQRPNASFWGEIFPALAQSGVPVQAHGFEIPRVDVLAALSNGFGVPSARNVSGDGGQYSFNIAAPAGAAWRALSTTPWIEVTTESGTGSGSLLYQVAPNPDSSPRSGRIRLFDHGITIHQAGGTQQPEQPPTADFAVLPDSPATGTPVTLDGSLSSDPGGFALSYQWELEQRPGGSQAVIQGSTAQLASLLPDRAGQYRVRLAVSNGTYSHVRTRSFHVSTQDEGELIIDDEAIYFENVNLGVCQLRRFGPLTVPPGQVWRRFKFAYSQSDLVFLIRRNAPVELNDANGFNCSNGYAQSFFADGEYDFYNGTAIFNHYMTAVPGDQLHFAMFSYDGESNINVPGLLDIETGPISAPGFSLPAGLYQQSRQLSLSAHHEASIRYTLDGSLPTGSSLVYQGPITLAVDTTTRVRARAFHPHLGDSTVAEATYVITGTTAPPSFLPEPGSYPESIDIQLSAHPEAIIRYTLDGTDPTASSPLFAQEIQLDPAPGSGATGEKASFEIRARAFRTDWAASDVVSAQYTLTGQLDRPQVSLAPGHYIGDRTIEVLAPFEGVTLFYSLDGSDPNCAGPLSADDQLSLTLESDLTLKVRACRDHWIPSELFIGEYSHTAVGSVRIDLEPEAVAEQAASWRLSSGGGWRTSGAVVDQVPAGEVTVEFSPVEGWVTPGDLVLTVQPGQETVQTVTYTAIERPDALFNDNFRLWTGLPTVELFTINGQSGEVSIQAGQTLHLAWQVSGAQVCQGQGQLPGWSGPLPHAGSTMLSSAAIAPGESAAVRLVCANPEGVTETEITVSAQPPPPPVPEECVGRQPPAHMSRASQCLWNNSADCRSFDAVFGPFPGWSITRQFQLGPGQYAAMAFNSGSAGTFQRARIEASEPQWGVMSGRRLVTISRCPGDFSPEPGTATGRCYVASQSTLAPLIRFSFDQVFQHQDCVLEPNTDYFLNIVYTDSAEGTPTADLQWRCNNSSTATCGTLLLPAAL